MSTDVVRDLSFAVCFICGDPSAGLGWCPTNAFKARPRWLCDDPRCIHSASKAYGMPTIEQRKHAAEALEVGGQAAGAYLEEIGKTDLAEMTPDEWHTFLERFVAARAEHLRRLAAAFAPPF